MSDGNARAGCLGILRALTCKLIDLAERVSRERSAAALHDYRVTLRHLRTLLARADVALPTTGLGDCRQAWRKVMARTSPLRDMQVSRQLLVKMYRDEGDSLVPILDWLDARIRREQTRLIRYLGSAGWQRQLKYWQYWLDQAEMPAHMVLSSGPSMQELVADTLTVTEKRVLRQIQKLRSRPSAAALHELRKRFKQLRYLIRMYEPWLESKTSLRALRDLKQWQDDFGAAQDIESCLTLLDEFVPVPGQVATVRRFQRGLRLARRDARRRAMEIAVSCPRRLHKRIDRLCNHSAEDSQ